MDSMICMVLFWCKIVLTMMANSGYVSCNEASVDNSVTTCWNKSCGVEFDPLSPLINCSYVFWEIWLGIYAGGDISISYLSALSTYTGICNGDWEVCLSLCRKGIPVTCPDEFMKCEVPLDLKGNSSAKEELGYGCVKFGGQRYQDVERTRLMCQVLENIECYGERTFLSIKHYPCIKYTGHYFLNTLLFSVLLGFLGMDRFCLGHTGTAVGKLLTVGGVGIWWIVDIILLALGELRPADDSNWVPYY